MIPYLQSECYNVLQNLDRPRQIRQQTIVSFLQMLKLIKKKLDPFKYKY